MKKIIFIPLLFLFFVSLCFGGLIDSNDRLILHANGADTSTTFPDASDYSQTVTANGNAQVDTAQSKFGGASFLSDANGDYLAVGDTSTFKFLHAVGTTGKWTIDFWFKANGFTANQYFFDTSASASANIGCAIYMNTNRTLVLNLVYGTQSEVICFFATTGTFPDDTTSFHHIALTYDQSLANGNGVFYVDGTALAGTGNKTANTPSTANSSYALSIGAYNVGGGSINGWMDEIRISDVKRYTENFTPETSEYSRLRRQGILVF